MSDDWTHPPTPEQQDNAVMRCKDCDYRWPARLNHHWCYRCTSTQLETLTQQKEREHEQDQNDPRR